MMILCIYVYMLAKSLEIFLLPKYGSIAQNEEFLGDAWFESLKKLTSFHPWLQRILRLD